MNPYAASTPYQPTVYGAGMYPQINYTQPPFRHILPGKSVNSPDEIALDDVPGDGSISLFPKKDGSCIFVRYRNGLGIVTTDVYVPQETTEENISEVSSDSDVAMAEVFDKLNTIIDLLNKRPKRQYNNSYKKKNNQNGTEKEVTDNATES